jgi:hypothetical protein
MCIGNYWTDSKTIKLTKSLQISLLTSNFLDVIITTKCRGGKMNIEWAITFILFVAVNTYMSYKAGYREGQFKGMLSLSFLLNEKNMLKNFKSIIGYKNLPLPVRTLLEDPHRVLEESK